MKHVNHAMGNSKNWGKCMLNNKNCSIKYWTNRDKTSKKWCKNNKDRVELSIMFNLILQIQQPLRFHSRCSRNISILMASKCPSQFTSRFQFHILSHILNRMSTLLASRNRTHINFTRIHNLILFWLSLHSSMANNQAIWVTAPKSKKVQLNNLS